MRLAVVIVFLASGCGFTGNGTGGGNGAGSDGGRPMPGSGSSGSGDNPEAGQQVNPEAGQPGPEAGQPADAPTDAPNNCNFAQIALHAQVIEAVGGVASSTDDSFDFTDKQPNVELPGKILVDSGDAGGGCAELDIKVAADHSTLRCRYAGNGASYDFAGCRAGAACPSGNGNPSGLQAGDQIKLENVVTLHLATGQLLTTTKATAILAQCDDGN